MDNNLNQTLIMLGTTTISTALFIARKINIYDDFSAFEVSVFETFVRNFCIRNKFYFTFFIDNRNYFFCPISKANYTYFAFHLIFELI